MLSWHIITRAVYDAASTADKSAEKLFFLSDTHEIYRGTENFTESVILYTAEPTVKAVGKLYVDANTLEGKIWNGTAWTTVIQPVQASIVSGDTSKPVSSKAVEDYVQDQISAVTGSDGLVASVGYAAESNSITVAMADGSSDTIPMTNVAADLVYDAASGLLQVKNAAGTTIGTGINLDLERFVKSATFNAETSTIILTFNDDEDPIEIPVGDLVDTYTAKSSTTIQMTVTGNEFTAEAIVSADAGNQLKKTDNGLYVAAVDISGKVDKVSSATAGAVATLTADGGITDSKVTVGGATVSGASASVLATEAAVAAIRDALGNAINGKMTKVAAGNEGKVIIADANGDAALSSVSVGGATFAAAPNASTLATEAGASAYADNVVAEALTWKTTI